MLTILMNAASSSVDHTRLVGMDRIRGRNGAQTRPVDVLARTRALVRVADGQVGAHHRAHRALTRVRRMRTETGDVNFRS